MTTIVYINFLKERGFYIAEQSRPNYPQTQLSLSSLLNLQYLNDWAKGLEETNYRPPLTETIRHSEVRRALTKIGYQTINIPNSTFISNIEDADVYLPLSTTDLNQFEGMILSTTALNIFAQKWELGLPVPGYTHQRRTIQYQLDTLKNIPSLTGPKFVFVHILASIPRLFSTRMAILCRQTRPLRWETAEAFRAQSLNMKKAIDNKSPILTNK